MQVGALGAVVVRDRVSEGAAVRLEAGVWAAPVALAGCRAGVAGVVAASGRADVS
ncbi:hypothetical protein ACIQVL_43720 [Streptomyces sp. NPDC090499]|uniref:hypothetical protein n=1 Tax=unclassified Streptomyces TaxID=2593676 RepID=UPI00381BEE6F